MHFFSRKSDEVLMFLGIKNMIYQDGFPLDRPVALVGANTKENFERIKEIVCEEIPVLPYCELI